MRPGVTIALTAVDRRRLGAIVGNRNVPQKHAWRAEIVLLTADGLGTVEIMRRTGKSKTCVWRWQERFALPLKKGRAGTDPRLQAPWHHHAVRRPQHPRRHRPRSLHAAPPAPRVHPLPQRHRG